MSDWLVTRGKPSLVLAPMEGYTDAPMRAWQGEIGVFSFAVSEFLRVSALVPPRHVFLRHIPELEKGAVTPSGLPVVVQLLGGHAERVAQSAFVAVDAGAKAIDLNFGCPAKTVNRHDGGATLLKYPQRIFEMVSAVRRAVPAHVSVSAKMRLGFEDPRDIFVNAEMAEKAGANWITIHGRTKTQGYQPPAYWKPIGEVTRAVGIPVVANGDIWTVDDFRRCRDESGCEHFMIGRGAIANPMLSVHIARELGLTQREVPATPTREQHWIPWLGRYEHFSAGYPRPDSEYLTRRVKQWLKMAQSRGMIDWFDEIKRVERYPELVAVLGISRQPSRFQGQR